MSGNTIQSIEKVLSQQNNGLTQQEIKTICTRLSESKGDSPTKFRRALTDDLLLKDSRASLEGMMMYWTGDSTLAAMVVSGSETTPDNVDIDAVVSEIRHRDQNWGKDGNGWDRYRDDHDSDDSNSISTPNTKSNQRSSPQRRRSTTISNLDHLDPYENRKREIRKDLFGI